MINALLVHPRFSPNCFWNYSDVCTLMGAKYPAAPLGLITLAALLPGEWKLRLVDTNTRRLTEKDILWADVVFIGGMLPQQASFLEVMDWAHRLGKRVVAGGPDPSSQPEIYRDADFLVLGEAEQTIPQFLKDFDKGATGGFYPADGERPDIRLSPVPRFDLLCFRDYFMIGIQLTRGCPFHCEFCDVTELFGRRPRMKTADQILCELETLYALGFRGHVDFVDDNFIANRKHARKVLRAVRDWSISHHYPFFFSTEASIDLADDHEFLCLLRDADFRYVFIGVETNDESSLQSAGKTQNLHRRMVDDIATINNYGLIVNGGFIIGFDGESRRAARGVANFVQQSRICMAMVGLLHALPNTQLARRLKSEGRYQEDSNILIRGDHHRVDQTTAGLNFITTRPREQIMDDYLSVVRSVYSTKAYFNRCLQLGRVLKARYRYRASPALLIKSLRGLTGVIIHLGLLPPVSYFFWRNVFIILLLNPKAVEAVVCLMAMYIHFRRQSRYISEVMSPLTCSV